MTDSIVQDVRKARASLAADFDYDLHKFFAWAKDHTAAERQAKHRLPARTSRSAQPATSDTVINEAPLGFE
ncbi:hypothetical protein BH11VER1_BH11VER1_11470 [soil metagenome]